MLMTRRRHGDGRDNREHTLSSRAPDAAQCHFDGRYRAGAHVSVVCRVAFWVPALHSSARALQRVRDTRGTNKNGAQRAPSKSVTSRDLT